uniref:Uncharacterized protein n=1 Tax=Rhizophora mucronata TaxID=61149 RepID=A0A2P2QFA9_RHIMU
MSLVDNIFTSVTSLNYFYEWITYLDKLQKL